MQFAQDHRGCHSSAVMVKLQLTHEGEHQGQDESLHAKSEWSPQGETCGFYRRIINRCSEFCWVINFLSTTQQTLWGRGVGVRAMDIFAEPKPSQVLLFSLHQMNALKVPLETPTWKY